MLVAALMMSCGDSSNTTDTAAAPPPPPVDASVQTTTGSDAAMNAADANGTVGAPGSTARYDATGKADPNGNYNADGTLRAGVVLTPVQERTDAMANISGIRATLMTELDQVRAELKQGGMDKAKTDADKAEAADLAQGLQRIDLALAKMGGATDMTWNDMRTAQLKEASDVRVWWNAHVDKQEEMAKK